MSDWKEQLTILDLTLVVLDGVVLLIALGSALSLIFIVASRPRVENGSRAASAIVCGSCLEIALLISAVPWFLWASYDSLARFGGESMLPMIAAPATRLATPLLLALVIANAMAFVTALRLPRS